MRKKAVFTILGMNRDLAMSKFDARFAYENKNLRLVTDESNSKFVMTNERGPKPITLYKKIDSQYTEITIVGKTLGVAVVNSYLVLFTHKPLFDENPDSIYRVEFVGEKAVSVLLYNGDLGFDMEHPIETIPMYENEKIQKVYWTDGINQPRMINIVDETSIYNDNSFDFAQKIGGNETIAVSRTDNTNGLFASGTIQYFFTYYKNYGQETNIVRISPISYISDSDRGTMNENIGCSFNINIGNIVKTFDGVRLYSIQRTSIDTAPTVKRIADIPIRTSTTITYTDNGITGDDVDSSSILYLGCKDIRVQTIAQKDNTMFMGNITEKHATISAELKSKLTSSALTLGFANTKSMALPKAEGYYPYKNQLSSNAKTIKYFKYGETYRFGIQLQDRYGNWSDVIRVTDGNGKDFVQTLRPVNSLEDEIRRNGNIWAEEDTDGTTMTFAEFVGGLNLSTFGEDLLKDYVAIRPVVVYPDQLNRTIVAQGIVCPTIYNIEDRVKNGIAGQASWFARPIGKFSTSTPTNYLGERVATNYDNLEYRHMCPIPPVNEYKNNNGQPRGFGYASRAEIACNFNGKNKYDEEGHTKFASDYTIWGNLYPTKDVITNRNNGERLRSEQLSSIYFVDQSILTFHSPEIEFDTRSQVMQYDDVKMRIVGIVPITSTSQNVHIDLDNADSDDVLSTLNFVYSNRTSTSYKSKWQLSEFGGIKGDFDYTEEEGGIQVHVKSWRGYMRIYPWHTKTLTYKDTKDLIDIADTEIFDDYTNIGYAIPVADTLISTKCYDTLQYSFNNLYCREHGLDYSIVKPNIYLTENEGMLQMNKDERFVNNPLNSFIFDMGIDKTIISKTHHYQEDEYVVGFVPSGVCSDITHSDMNPTGSANQSTCNIHATEGVMMKYKTTSCALIQLEPIKRGDNGLQSILPKFGTTNNFATESISSARNNEVAWRTITTPTAFDMDEYGVQSHLLWDSTKKIIGVDQQDITDHFPTNGTVHFISDSIATNEMGYFYIAELYRPNVINRFGGDSDEAVAANVWTPCGNPISLRDNLGNLKSGVQIIWSEGDTYYQRYDNLHTYPYTFEDVNQIVDIVSFMCETRVNIDGRYDKNRGKLNNESMSPINFNKLNDAYSQKDNVFQYRAIDETKIIVDDWPDIVAWSNTKTLGETTDTWTNVTLASTIDLDGVFGPVTALKNYRDTIFAFQSKSVCRLLYNENYAITAENGVPLTIANSGKISNKQYLTTSIGCKNKWSIVNSTSGMYFVDDLNRDIMLMGSDGQMSGIANKYGFGSWIKKNTYCDSIWSPGVLTNIRGLFDSNNEEVMFVTAETALSFSELFGGFTSFYDYGNTPFLENVMGHNVIMRNDFEETKLYEHNLGEYNNFFGKYKPFWTEIVCHSDGSNDDSPLLDKTWMNVGFIFDGFDGETYIDTDRFNSVEISNEYQHGFTDWPSRFYPAITKQYRHWSADIPRDDNRTQDRIRSQWVKVKLYKDQDIDKNIKDIVHSIDISYNE